MKSKALVGICLAAIAISTTFASACDASGQAPGTGELLLAAPFPEATEALAPHGPAGSLLEREVTVLMHLGASPAGATQDMDLLSELARTQLVRKLLASMGGEYAGVWLDPAAAQLHLGVISPVGWQEAEQAISRANLSGEIDLTPVRSTWAQLLAAQRRWNLRLSGLLARNAVETALAPQRNAVVVTLSASVSARQRAVLEHEAAVSGGTVIVTSVRARRLRIVPEANEVKCNIFATNKAYCDTPITPGVRIISEKERWVCTAGPLAIPTSDKNRTYLLTAGHCIQKARRVSGAAARPRWYAYNREGFKEEIGRSAQYLNNTKADIGAIKVDNPGYWVVEGNPPVYAVTAEWKKLEEKSFPVKGQEGPPVVGAPNCVEGQTSGAVCGTIRTVGVTAGSGRTMGLVEDLPESRTTARGDSGGPVIKETKGEYLVEGVHKGVLGGRPVYEPIETALKELNKLGLELLTTANEVRPKESEAEKEANEKFEKQEKEEEEGLTKESKEEEEAAEREEQEEKEEKEKEEKEEKEKHFTSTSKGGTVKAGGNVIACAKDTSTGELTSTMLFGAVVIHFLECRSSGSGGSNCSVKSTNTAGEGLVVTNTLHAILGLVLPSRGAGLLLLPVSGKTWETLLANSCTPETKVTGTLAGLITPTGKSETTSKVSFSVSSGKQEIKDIDTLAGLVAPELVAFTEQATEETTEEVTWGKAIEVP